MQHRVKQFDQDSDGNVIVRDEDKMVIILEYTSLQ